MSVTSENVKVSQRASAFWYRVPKLLAMVFLAFGCSRCTLPTADWYGDKDFSPQERSAIEEGFRFDAEHAGIPVPSISWTLERSEQPMPHTIRRQRGPLGGDAGVAGQCKDGTLYLDPVGLPNEGIKPEHLPGLAAHELAHCALGFVDGYHPNDPPTDGIMRVVYPMKWTDAEAAQCRDHADKCPAGR